MPDKSDGEHRGTDVAPGTPRPSRGPFPQQVGLLQVAEVVRFPDGAPEQHIRNYTARSVDPAAGRLTIDFFLHEEPGRAGNWATGATPGDTVGFGGARTHWVTDPTAGWSLLVPTRRVCRRWRPSPRPVPPATARSSWPRCATRPRGPCCHRTTGWSCTWSTAVAGRRGGDPGYRRRWRPWRFPRAGARSGRRPRRASSPTCAPICSASGASHVTR
jgi:hypothetical protein